MKKLKKLNDVKVKTLENTEMKNLTGGDDAMLYKTWGGIGESYHMDSWEQGNTFDKLWGCIGL